MNAGTIDTLVYLRAGFSGEGFPESLSENLDDAIKILAKWDIIEQLIAQGLDANTAFRLLNIGRKETNEI